ncbi:MAG: transrane phosphoesterase [Betaproteobacteria bacterium]|nr:transrane phosphoesterase [Betaproteobacteria bacterium]
MADYSEHLIVHGIFYGSHLVWLYLAWALWRWRRHRQHSRFAVRVALGLLFVWMRFVEPQWIIERETRTALHTGTRVALISDLHLGAYNNAAFVARLAEHINALKPDCTVIAGDFLYAPDAPLDTLLATLKNIHGPVYAVLGNHDSHEVAPPHGGDVPTAMVREALTRAGVQGVEDRVVDCGRVKIAGIGDLWTGNADFRAAQAYKGAAPLVLLTHNPDLAYQVPRNLSRLLLAGHTHGGQIRLPFVYRYVIPVKGPFDRGLLTAAQWSDDLLGRPDVFTTSGVGEIGLPMRLLNPPAVDLLLL